MTRRIPQVLAAVLLAGRASAVVRNVPADYPSIQACVNAAVAGDTCLVAPGVFQERPATQVDDVLANVDVNKAITIKAASLYQTVLDGVDRMTTFFLMRAPAHIEGFVIKNAGTGVIQRANPAPPAPSIHWTARNLIITGCERGVGVDDKLVRQGDGDVQNILVDNADIAYYTNDAIGLTIRNSIASNSRVGFSGCNHSSFSFSYSLGFNLGTVRESACSGTAYLPVAAGPQALISTDPEYRHVQTALHDLPYLLRCTSPAVDMGDSAVTDEDSTFPPSWGAPHNDIGAYGGPGGALAMDDTERAYVAGQLLSVSKTSISWCALPEIFGTDVIRGDLGALRSTGGNFTPATLECLANDSLLPSLSDSVDPGAGTGSWFLTRFDGGPLQGSYDESAPSQTGLRDAEIEASGQDCP